MAEQAGERGGIKGAVSDSLLTGRSAEGSSSTINILSEFIRHFQLEGIDEAEFCFDLPLLVVEHKKERSVVQGPNKLRMDLAACTAFLEALCITKFPIFGLSTNGCQGVVTCCELELVEVPLNEGEKYPVKVSIAILVCSTVSSSDNSTLQHTRIFERNARIFDISKPIEAFNFVTFLCSLADDHAHKLVNIFQARCDQVVKLNTQNHVQNWTMAAQVRERGDSLRRSRSSEDNTSPADVNPSTAGTRFVKGETDNEDVSIH